MNFSCERGELLDVISNIQPVIPTRSTHPVLSNVLLLVEKEGLTILGTDLDISIKGKVEGSVIEEGAIAVPAKRLLELLRELGEGEVNLKRDGERIIIKKGTGRFTVSGVEKEDFPVEDILGEKQKEIKLKSSYLEDMLKATTFAISSDVARISLSGLFLKTQGKEIIAVATDGHRLTMIKKELEEESSEEFEMIIPQKTVGNLNKMLGSEKEVHMIIGNGTVCFDIGKYTLTSKLIMEKFPDYTQVIPKDNTMVLIAEKSIFSSAVKRTSVLSNPLTHLVKLKINEGKCELSSSDYDVGGEAYEEIDVDYSDDPITIGFNSSYLMEILRHIESDEIKIMMKNPLSSSLIVPLPQDEGEEYLSILMPLRLPEDET